MHPVVLDVLAVQAALVSEILLELLVDVFCHRLPAGAGTDKQRNCGSGDCLLSSGTTEWPTPWAVSSSLCYSLACLPMSPGRYLGATEVYLACPTRKPDEAHRQSSINTSLMRGDRGDQTSKNKVPAGEHPWKPSVTFTVKFIVQPLNLCSCASTLASTSLNTPHPSKP